MKRVLNNVLSLCLVFISFSVFADEPWDKVETGAYELKKGGKSYLIDISKKKNGDLILEWRGDVPKVSGGKIPKKFGYRTLFVSDNEVDVLNKEAFKKTKGYTIINGPYKGRRFTRTTTVRQKARIYWSRGNTKKLYMIFHVVTGSGYTNGSILFVGPYFKTKEVEFEFKKVAN